MEIDYAGDASWRTGSEQREIEYVIASMGGVASTAIMEHVEKYVKLNYTHFWPPLKSKFKHSRIPESSWNLKGAIFIYGDPRDACFSLVRRVLTHTHLRNMGIPERCELVPDEIQAGPGFNGKPCDLITYIKSGLDIFLFEQMLDNWLEAKTPYPRLVAHQDWIFENPDKVMKFLGTTCKTSIDEFPAKRERTSNWRLLGLDNELDLLYGTMLSKISKLKGYKVIDAS